ncbi:MAG TPA: ATPase [Xanthobacteraceae bacterium]|nr:ATPase [Xanthobacteraceae bacterium]
MTIDWWTLGIQTVNVVILVWLLQRYFWRPVAAMIEQRRAAAQRALADAEATRRQAAVALGEIEQTRAGFAAERETILAAAHAEAERTRSARLAEAAKEAASLEAAATAALEKERQAAVAAWAERSSRLAVDIAGRLAARLDGAAVRASFLEWLVQEIRTLPRAVRDAELASGAALEAISATPLDPADQERCRVLIGEALGAHPQIAFRTDPGLIAGLELRGPRLVVSNSWRADLTRILADLAHDDRR